MCPPAFYVGVSAPCLSFLSVHSVGGSRLLAASLHRFRMFPSFRRASLLGGIAEASPLHAVFASALIDGRGLAALWVAADVRRVVRLQRSAAWTVHDNKLTMPVFGVQTTLTPCAPWQPCVAFLVCCLVSTRLPDAHREGPMREMPILSLACSLIRFSGMVLRLKYPFAGQETFDQGSGSMPGRQRE